MAFDVVLLGDGVVQDLNDIHVDRTMYEHGMDGSQMWLANRLAKQVSASLPVC